MQSRDADPSLDALALLRHLADAEVDFVVVGGIAAGAHGSARVTVDLDLLYATEDANLERLRDALAGVAVSNVDLDLPPGAWKTTCRTRFGDLDLLRFPLGTPCYDTLRRAATVIDVDGRQVRIASPDHLIAMREVAGRTLDKLIAMELRVISDELRAPKDDRRPS